MLKVVALDRLKPEKSQQVNGSTGVVTDNPDGYILGDATPSSMATTSFSEGYLKTEPLYDTKMFHDSDSEFFQDLVQWCSTPAKDEPVLTIDSKKTEKRALTIDTPQTQFSPQDWDTFDRISPHTQTGFYNSTPVESLSPNIEGFPEFDNNYLGFPDLQKESKIQFQERFIDISSLPVVIGEMPPERHPEAHPWPMGPHTGWTNTHETDYTQSYTNTHNIMPFIDQEDSLDLKLVSVIPREVENNDVIVSEYIVKNNDVSKGVLQDSDLDRRKGGLSVDVSAQAPYWPNESVSTPEILSFVEQLEKEKCSQILKTNQIWPVQETTPEVVELSRNMDVTSPDNYEPITPKSESHVESDPDDSKSYTSKRRRHDSEDSDISYTPYDEQKPRKYKRRKPNVPIKEMIIALEGSQQLTKARRGRPPKRRESNVSSACSVDENSSCASTHETKYRVLRDKNNEASKRSRMNRKLKELQMEQLATDLEEKNKKLKVKADILEDVTKRLKEALMTAILQK